jgi:hypothetical protein
MAVKAMTLVGLDVHARQTHAAIVDPVSGELRVVKLRLAPIEVAAFLETLGPGVVAVYEAGPTGFGLARVARERGIDVRVVAPGSIPKGPGDRVKTDRRDAIRLVRQVRAQARRALPRAGRHLDSRAPSVAARAAIPRRLLTRDVRGLPGLRRAARRAPGKPAGRARTADPRLKPRPGDRQAALLQRHRHAVGRRTVRRDRRLQPVSTAHTAIGISRHRPVRTHQRHQAPAGHDHQGRAATRPPAARRGRPPLPLPAAHRRDTRATPARPGPARHRDRMARATPRSPTLGAPCTNSAASPPASSRSLAPASCRRFFGRPQPLTDHTPITAPGTLPGRARAPRRSTTVAAGSRRLLWATSSGWPRPLLDSEPRRTPGLEVTALGYQSDPAVDALDLPLVPPRQRPDRADEHTMHRQPTGSQTPYQ